MKANDVVADEAIPSAVPERTAESGWSRRMWAMLIVLCGAMFLDALDNAMVGIAVPPIQAEFGMSTSAVQWVVSAYVLGFGGFLLVGGRLADIVGRRRLLLLGVGAFAVASAVGGLAQDGTWVIAARFIMGVAAAFTAPAGLAIIVTTFPEGPQRNRAVGIYTACGATGFSLGLVAGGILTQIGWRWTFFLPVLAALAILVGAIALVPRDAAVAEPKPRIDWVGAFSITAAMLLLVFGLVEAPTRGWTSTPILASFVGALILVVAFVITEKSVAFPLVRLEFLRNGGLVGASLFAAAILGTYMSFQFIGALYLQELRGWEPIEMALGFLPAGLLIAFFAPRAGGYLGKLGIKKMIVIGFVAYTLAYLLFLRIGLESSYAPYILPSMLLIGVAFPFSFTGSYVQATSGVADEEQGLAAGILQTGYQVGAALVLALTTATMTANTGPGREGKLDGYHAGIWVVSAVSVVALIGAVVSWLSTRKVTQDA
ncbi:MFS transporter [Knoellia sp. CPCC 206453]|uniref:MFS transporter n=1 Tax=Knoellia pratensis TaxID=3404796 RepID=UPI00361B66E5